MSRAYRAVSYLEVDAVLPQSEYPFWQDVLYRSVDEPTDVIEENNDAVSLPHHVDAYSVPDRKTTQFRFSQELTLGCGCTMDDYADDFRQAVHKLTLTVPKDLEFRVSLDMYYLEHDADFSAEFDRRELAG
jgi:hypothetical protein